MARKINGVPDSAGTAADSLKWARKAVARALADARKAAADCDTTNRAHDWHGRVADLRAAAVALGVERGEVAQPRETGRGRFPAGAFGQLGAALRRGPAENRS